MTRQKILGAIRLVYGAELMRSFRVRELHGGGHPRIEVRVNVVVPWVPKALRGKDDRELLGAIRDKLGAGEVKESYGVWVLEVDHDVE